MTQRDIFIEVQQIFRDIFDDQVETVLYRLLRGSGSKGLTGIPKLRKLAHGMIFRPLLGMKKIDIQN